MSYAVRQAWNYPAKNSGTFATASESPTDSTLIR
jgi:hypothetical protein